MAKKKKTWLAVVGGVVAALLTVGLVFALFPQKKPCDHVWDEGKVAVASTCSTKGKKVLTCSECGEISALSMPVRGHDFVYNGVDDAFCSVCDVSIHTVFFDAVPDEISAESGWYSLIPDVDDDDNYLSTSIMEGDVQTYSSEYDLEDITIEVVFDVSKGSVFLRGSACGYDDKDESFDISIDFEIPSFVSGYEVFFYLDLDSDVIIESDIDVSFSGIINWMSIITEADLYYYG